MDEEDDEASEGEEADEEKHTMIILMAFGPYRHRAWVVGQRSVGCLSRFLGELLEGFLQLGKSTNGTNNWKVCLRFAFFFARHFCGKLAHHRPIL